MTVTLTLKAGRLADFGRRLNVTWNFHRGFVLGPPVRCHLSANFNDTTRWAQPICTFVKRFR